MRVKHNEEQIRNIERKSNESKNIIMHSQNESSEKIEHRNYEPIIGKSKSDEYDDESEKIKKKFFSIAAPTVNLRKRGRGCHESKCMRNILGG